MAMPFVLIVIAAGGAYTYPTTAMQEFNTAAACQNAKREITESPMWRVYPSRVVAVCVPKGFSAPTTTGAGEKGE
jgi:hypothetical protein